MRAADVPTSKDFQLDRDNSSDLRKAAVPRQEYVSRVERSQGDEKIDERGSVSLPRELEAGSGQSPPDAVRLGKGRDSFEDQFEHVEFPLRSSSGKKLRHDRPARGKVSVGEERIEPAYRFRLATKERDPGRAIDENAAQPDYRRREALRSTVRRSLPARPRICSLFAFRISSSSPATTASLFVLE